MKRNVRMAVGVSVAVLATALAAYVGMPRGAAYTIHGLEIVTTTASDEQLGTLLSQTAWTLGDVNDLGNGRRQFPSFHQGARSWNDGAGKSLGSRSVTEFDDKNGNHCTIERVSIPGTPEILLLKSEDPTKATVLLDEVMRQFELLKVRHKE
jgi:hypothetical protein